jgi:chemotaxis protein MotB
MAKKTMVKEYLGIADMMSGMMMVFMLIAIAFMLNVEASKKEIEVQKNAIEAQKNAMAEIAEMAERSRSELHQQLVREFRQDLAEWNAKILEDNTVRFKAPDILFEGGSSDLRPRFEQILTDFFSALCRYFRGLSSRY